MTPSLYYILSFLLPQNFHALFPDSLTTFVCIFDRCWHTKGDASLTTKLLVQPCTLSVPSPVSPFYVPTTACTLFVPQTLYTLPIPFCFFFGFLLFFLLFFLSQSFHFEKVRRLIDWTRKTYFDVFPSFSFEVESSFEIERLYSVLKLSTFWLV